MHVIVPTEQDPTPYEDLGMDVVRSPYTGFTKCLNGWLEAHEWESFDAIGAFGDDVVFRTPGWDQTVQAAMPAIVFGDDTIHGENHPTAVFMSPVIIKALRWLALPAVNHQWADDGWKTIGLGAGCLRYLPGVVFEHEHPAKGEGDKRDSPLWDEGYEQVFDDAAAKADYEGFESWRQQHSARDIRRVRTALSSL